MFRDLARASSPPPYEGIRGLAFASASAAAAGAYVLAGLVGLSLASVHESASPVWPPTGIAIASFLLLGPRVWPAIAVAAFGVNLATSGHVPTSLAIAAGNTLEGLVAAWLVRAFAGGTDAFSRPQGIGRFVLLGAGVATMVSATIGVVALSLAGLAEWSSFQAIWVTWWLGDATGAIVVTPPLVLWHRARPLGWSAGEAWEAAALGATTLLVGFGVFTTSLPLAWTVVPLVIWAALRFTTREAATVGLVLNAIAVWGLAHGLGPFHADGPYAAPLILQGSVSVTSLVGLFLGAVTMERREAERSVRASRDALQREVEARTANLAESEERFAGFLRNIPGLAWIKDGSGRYRSVNAPFAAAIGLRREDVVGRTDEDLFPASIAREYRANDEEVRRAGRVVRTIERQVVGDEVRHSLVHKFPMPTARDEGAVGGVAIDITSRLAAEEAARASEERLKEAQRVSGVGSWEWDVAANAVRWSEELYRIYGVEEGTPATYEGFLARVHPEDRERVDGIVRGAFGSGVFPEFDHRIVRPDGEVRWLHARGTVVRGEDGGVASMNGTAQDVTEATLAREAALESERKFRTVFDASPIAIVVSRPLDGTNLEANEAFAALIGRPRAALVGHATDALAMERVGRSGAAGERSFEFHARVRRPDGTVREVLGSDVVLRIGGETSLVSLLKDVTEIRRAEEVARQASAQAKEIEALREMGAFKTRFINMAAHELNTPLTPIKLQLHLLRRAASGEKEREALEVVLRNFDRMATLVQNMLDVGRIQSGKMPLRRERMDLADVARHVERSFAGLADERGVALRASAPGGLLVEADRARVEQVLFNLVGNALKFTPEGGEVDIDVAREGGDVLVRVRDTGPGLDEGQRRALFQPFSQVHAQAQTSASPGVGLGLFISREFAELHGGALWVESEGRGKGATFLLRLPALVAPTPERRAMGP